MRTIWLDIGGTKIAAVMDAHSWEIRRYRCPTQSRHINNLSHALWRLSSRLGGTFNDRCWRKDRLTRQYLATHWPD